MTGVVILNTDEDLVAAAKIRSPLLHEAVVRVIGERAAIEAAATVAAERLESRAGEVASLTAIIPGDCAASERVRKAIRDEAAAMRADAMLIRQQVAEAKNR